MGMQSWLKTYIDLGASIGHYWRVYGGFYDFIRSPYLLVAFVISLICYPIWSSGSVKLWYDIAIQITPNILGFALCGYAMLLCFGGSDFVKGIAGSVDGTVSPFLQMNGTFVHFILVNCVALIIAVIEKALSPDLWIIKFVGTLVFICFASAGTGQTPDIG